MKGSSGTLLRTLLLVFLAASGTVQGGEDADSIRSLRAEYNQAIAAHDVDAIIGFLDDEYVVTASTGDVLQGSEVNVASWAGHFAEFPDVVYVRTPEAVIISEAHPVAMENGTWSGSMTTEHGKLEKGGQYSAGWRKVAGVWKIHSELFVALYCHGEGC